MERTVKLVLRLVSLFQFPLCGRSSRSCWDGGGAAERCRRAAGATRRIGRDCLTRSFRRPRPPRANPGRGRAAAGRAPAPVDLPVQILDPKGEIPRALKPGDFTVVDGGQTRPALSLAPLSRPWRIVVYVDRVLTGSRTLRAAAGTLAEQAAALTALGTVEVVVAEPRPRVARGRPATSRPSTRPSPSSGWRARGGTTSASSASASGTRRTNGADPAERAAQGIEDEARLVRHQQDAFAEWLVAQEGDAPRAVFLVSDGFDVNPAKFYRGSLAEGDGALEKTALETARTAAALGWIVFPLPVGDSTLPDLRRVRPRSTPQVPIGGTITLGRKKPGEGPAAPAAGPAGAPGAAELDGGGHRRRGPLPALGAGRRPHPPALPLRAALRGAPRGERPAARRWRCSPPAPTSGSGPGGGTWPARLSSWPPSAPSACWKGRTRGSAWRSPPRVQAAGTLDLRLESAEIPAGPCVSPSPL